MIGSFWVNVWLKCLARFLYKSCPEFSYGLPLDKLEAQFKDLGDARRVILRRAAYCSEMIKVYSVILLALDKPC